MNSYFPDVNVWVAAVYQRHTYHERAADWLESLGTSRAYFTRVTQLSFLRIISNPAALQADALDLKSAWLTYQRLRGANYIGFISERDPAAIDEIMPKLTTSSLRSHQVWPDAYLVAFARVAGLTFVTFDRTCHQLAKPDSILLA